VTTGRLYIITTIIIITIIIIHISSQSTNAYDGLTDLVHPESVSEFSRLWIQ